MSMCTKSFVVPDSEYEIILEVINKGNYEIMSQWQKWLQIQNDLMLECDIKMVLNIHSISDLENENVEKICNILHVKVQK